MLGHVDALNSPPPPLFLAFTGLWMAHLSCFSPTRPCLEGAFFALWHPQVSSWKPDRPWRHLGRPIALWVALSYIFI